MLRNELHPLQAGKISISGYYHGIRAETLYINGSLKKAAAEQVEALLLAHHFQDPGLLIPMYILRAKLHLANGEQEIAHETVQHAFLYTQNSYWRRFLHAFQAFIYLKENRLPLAEQIFLHVQNDYAESPGQHPFISLVHARLLLECGQWEAALEKVLSVKQEAFREGQPVTFIEACIVESVCYERKKYWPEMSRLLQEAMACSKKFGCTQLFTEEERIGAMLLGVQKNT